MLYDFRPEHVAVECADCEDPDAVPLIGSRPLGRFLRGARKCFQ